MTLNKIKIDQYLWSWMLNENMCWIITPPLKNERLEINSIYCKKHVMRFKTTFPQISENFIKYTMKAKIYKYTISFSEEGVIPIKPVLSNHAVVSGLEKLYSYDHNEKIGNIL